MEHFKSGWKQSYYGKGDVIVYRLNRDGVTPPDRSPVFGANVKILLYGEAFWPSYTTGDNAGLIATDSMKNFVQRETLNYHGPDLEEFCRFLSTKFLATYPQVEGLQLSAVEIPYNAFSQGSVAFAPSAEARSTARIEINRSGTIEAASGLIGFRHLRLGGSAFYGFVRDEYTTLPEIKNRPLQMFLDLEWHYTTPDAAFSTGKIPFRVRSIVRDVFESFDSGSIQQIVYQTGTKILAEIPEIAEVHLEANNRTWDTIAEHGDDLGVFTDSRPPYGCIGLKLKR